MGKAAIDTRDIVRFIKDSKEPVNKEQILKATNYKGDYQYAMKMVLSENEDIERIGTKTRALYIFNPKKPLNSEMRNHEGYLDVTAGRAIANVSKVENDGNYPMGQKFGGVYGWSGAKGYCEGILIVAAKAGSCIGYGVYPDRQTFMLPKYTKTITDPDGHLHYIFILSPVHAYGTNVRQLKFMIPQDEKQKLKEYVADAMNIESAYGMEEVKKENKCLTDKLAVAEKEIDELRDANNRLGDKLATTLAEMEKYREQCDNLLDENARLAESAKDIQRVILETKCRIYEKLLF